MQFSLSPLILLLLAFPVFSFGLSSTPTKTSTEASIDHGKPARYPVIDLREPNYLAQMIPALKQSRVVFVGETHANYAHHLLQLSVIEQLADAGVDLAIGMEMFQQPVQTALNAFIAGKTTEREMLVQTEWFDRWKYDYRLYRPIVKFAAKHAIPIAALSVPTELVVRVSESGLAGLTDHERSRIPQAIDFSDKAYQDHLETVYNQHGSSQRTTFNRFMEVQLLWDEGMAEQAFQYLQRHPNKTLVMLVGSGHVRGGYGIPNRLQRRMDIKSTTILPQSQFEFDSTIADFVVFAGEFQLPPAGMLGIYMTQTENSVVVADLVDGGAAGKNGIKRGDTIQSINQIAITTATDVKIALFDMQPGDEVEVTVGRNSFFGAYQEIIFTLSLGGSPPPSH